MFIVRVNGYKAKTIQCKKGNNYHTKRNTRLILIIQV